MSEQQQRVDNVKTMAARIAKNGEGLNVREFLDASALAGATLIKAVYRGPAQSIALQRYVDQMLRTINGR
jgi:hypothetical protein